MNTASKVKVYLSTARVMNAYLMNTARVMKSKPKDLVSGPAVSAVDFASLPLSSKTQMIRN